MCSPQLTDEEISILITDLWNMTGRDPEIDIEREMANAATRKALTWAVEQITELSTHLHELPHEHGAFRAGVETAAEELKERARLAGIAPWED